MFLSVHGRFNGGPLGKGGIRGILRHIKNTTGINADVGIRLSAHTFRHTFSKMYMEQGGEVLSLSRELGHSSVSITEKYLGTFGSHEARKEHTSFSPIGMLNLKKGRNRNKKE